MFTSFLGGSQGLITTKVEILDLKNLPVDMTLNLYYIPSKTAAAAKPPLSFPSPHDPHDR
jgi:hypothetical protein